jgi:hypothetical protein
VVRRRPARRAEQMGHAARVLRPQARVVVAHPSG